MDMNETRQDVTAASARIYPPARKGDQIDDCHGVPVADPYRWLEDADSAETRAWIEAQNRLTFGHLESIPGRDRIKARLTRLWDYEKVGIPRKEGGRYFFARNDGLQNQSVLYVAEALDREPRVLLDPNTLSPDGTVALSGRSVSDDGRYLAYGLATAGSDWQEWKVREVATGRDTADHLRWVKFSGASWTKDGAGFFYSRYDEPAPGAALRQANYHQKLYYHRLGTAQSEDVLVYERPDHKDWGFGGQVSDDGRYLVVTVWQGTERKNRVFFKDLGAGMDAAAAPMVELLPDADASYGFIDNDGPVFFFRTDRDAPRGRLIAIDTRRPGPEDWAEILGQADEVLEGVSRVGGRFLVVYLRDAFTQVKVFDRDGALVREVDLPGIGSAYGFGGKNADTETFYAFDSFTTPPAIYRYDVSTGASALFRRPGVDFDPADYQTLQVFYESKDGTRVPMFLTHRKGLVLDGNHPTLLYGYGGFNNPMTPGFSPANLVWMEMGGVYAVACLRGGGEYGEAWHEAGKKRNKQNVFDDFIAAAEWLIRERVTSPARLAIAGGSNGGLLVAACVNQRPDLFGAALPAVGVMDMLRFHKFTIGWAWTSEYGSPDDPEEFRVLHAYSPLHNLRPGTAYPATLVTTSDHDDRVVPAHSFKYAAALQAAQGGGAPVLIRVETRAGHGGGKPTGRSSKRPPTGSRFSSPRWGCASPKHGAPPRRPSRRCPRVGPRAGPQGTTLGAYGCRPAGGPSGFSPGGRRSRSSSVLLRPPPPRSSGPGTAVRRAPRLRAR
jgi:prolyl oligopeptidase